MKSKLTKIPIQQLTSGDTSTLLVYTFIGEPGPKVYIQANIHGPEIAGIEVVSEFINFLEKQPEIKGSITLVSSANPIALNSKIGGFPIGYINHNGDSSNSWNRIFLDLSSKDTKIKEFIKNNLHLPANKLLSLYKKYLINKLVKIKTDLKYGLSIENKLALVLQNLSVNADYVIDLHSAGYNQLHIYTFPQTLNSAKFFGVKHILKLPLEFTGAFDESFYLPWTKLASIYKELIGKEIIINKEVFTLELENDNEINSLKTKKYIEMLMNYLKSKKVLKAKAVLPKLKFFACGSQDYVKYFTPIGGLVEPLVYPSQKVTKGTSLIKITSIDQTPKKVILYAQEECIINSLPLSKVVSEGEPVVGVLKNLKEI